MINFSSNRSFLLTRYGWNKICFLRLIKPKRTHIYHYTRRLNGAMPNTGLANTSSSSMICTWYIGFTVPTCNKYVQSHSFPPKTKYLTITYTYFLPSWIFLSKMIDQEAGPPTLAHCQCNEVWRITNFIGQTLLTLLRKSTLPKFYKYATVN